MTELTLLAAFSLGLLGSGHCIGMCGGIGTALGVKPGQEKNSLLLAYNGGRIITYALIGALAGVLGEGLVMLAPQATVWLRVLAGLLMVAMGLYLSRWWLGLARLEAIGAKLWQRLRPLTASLLPVNTAGQALRLGMLWGLLPCGLVYSTLALALLAANPVLSAALMFTFGLGTLPALLLTSFAAKKMLSFSKQSRVRAFASVSIIFMGAYTASVPWLHAQHHNHHMHKQAATTAEERISS